MFADVSDTGLVMLGGWIAVLVGVSLLRDVSPARRAGRLAGLGVVALGLALAVFARVAV
jgi:hypothetical protein